MWSRAGNVLQSVPVATVFVKKWVCYYKVRHYIDQRVAQKKAIALIFLLEASTDGITCLQIGILSMRAELCNILKWTSDGTDLFSKITTFIKAYTICDVFVIYMARTP